MRYIFVIPFELPDEDLDALTNVAKPLNKTISEIDGFAGEVMVAFGDSAAHVESYLKEKE